VLSQLFREANLNGYKVVTLFKEKQEGITGNQEKYEGATGKMKFSKRTDFFLTSIGTKTWLL
jgi:hypothetical protein